MSQIGDPTKITTVEPIENPVPQKAPDREPAPEREPVKPEPEKTPA